MPKKNKKGGASFAPFVTGFKENMSDILYLDNLEHQVLLKMHWFETVGPAAHHDKTQRCDVYGQKHLRRPDLPVRFVLLHQNQIGHSNTASQADRMDLHG